LPINGGPNLCPNVVGTPVTFDESIDMDLTKLDGGGGINAMREANSRVVEMVLPKRKVG